MVETRRADIVARLLLTFAALLPYWRLLTFSVVFVTDDYFASDIFNGELPGRVLAGQALAAGRWPVWTSQLCSGFPLAGSPADPIGLALFAVLPPAPALDALIIILLLIAAHGSYSLARRLGADRTGAVLSGVAFAGSGYIACQLKHLSIVSTVVWLPVGLTLLDRAFEGGESTTTRRRMLALGWFGIVFAQQVLSGFPQSAYICGLVYGAFATFRAVSERGTFGHPRGWLALLAMLGGATLLAALAAAIVLLPMSALGSISDRAEALGYEWSTRLAYWPPNAITFLFPYAQGDISNNSYGGPPFFWEDYGYVGFATVWLALFGALRDRRRAAGLFLIAMTVLAYAFVLGQATPIFKVAYLLIPGLKLFRFPTRFLIVVELGLAILAALGLTRLREQLERRGGVMARGAVFVTAALCAVTAADLFVHQPRQNPMVPAATWLAPPATVATVSMGTTAPRTFTPQHRDLHRRAFQAARGWADVAPYYEIRDLLEPNIGGAFWNIPSADCYVGISPRWFVDVWGDHNRELSLVSLLAAYDFRAGTLRVHPSLPAILRVYGVTHLLSVFPAAGAPLPNPSRSGSAYVYEIQDAARVRFVAGASTIADDAAAAKRLLDPGFDGTREVLLHDAPAIASAPSAAAATATGTAAIVAETDRDVRITADAPAEGFLLLADTYYPGWSATVDGRPVPLYRANLSVRAIPVPAGRHDVRFTYDPPGVRRGGVFSAVGAAGLLMWVIAAGGFARFSRSRRRAESAS
jgi:hypothetical protein